MAARKSKHGYDGKIAGLYDLEDTIGRGHFAVVKLARHVFTGEKVAVKVIDKTKLDEVSRSHLFQEVRCMKLVQHPNVVRLYEVIDTQTKLYLILELGDGGDMYDYIMRHNGGLDEKVAKRYFRQIVEAISYCHKLHVVHRDLKPENVVFFEKVGLVKLTDFGFSNMFAPGKKLETSCGSLAYSAPEILLGDSYDAPAVDVWSLGVILFMLVVGEPPFQEANDSETLTMIMDCRYHVPPQISKDCKDLIGKMLQREPSKRATLSTIIAHPWLNDRDLTPMATFLPLITKEMISDEDQSYVVQKMVEGKIATREEILQSIEKNCYNHITATYYLLIERRLRKHQQHEHHTQNQQPSSGSLRKQSTPSPSRSAKPHLEPLMLSPRDVRVRKASLRGQFPLDQPVLEKNKQKEAKKTKTAPLSMTRLAVIPGGDAPAILVSPPVEESSTSPGSYFVKSLTTSMTLDRRKSSKKQSGSVSPRTQRKLSGQGEKTAQQKLSASRENTAQQKPSLSKELSPLGARNTVMSKSDPGTGGKRPPAAPVSKIALLSSFFERKAKQAATGEKDPKFNLGWLRARNRLSNLQGSCVDSGSDSGTSHYVQSLVSPPGTHPSTSTDSGRQLQTTPSPTDLSLMVPLGPGAIRKCSLISEESVDEYDDEDDDDMDRGCTIKPVKSMESLDEIGIVSVSSHLSLTPSSSPVASPSPSAVDAVNPRRPLKSVCSSPQLLNQIHEENESEDDDDIVPMKLSMPRRFGGSSASSREPTSASPEILRKYEQRKKRRGAGQRGTSCSSSDASDTDDTEGRSRKDKLRHKFIHRRDSSDHSSDTDGPGGNLGGNGRLGGASSGSKGSRTHNGNGSGGGGGRGGGGGGGGGGGSGGGGGRGSGRSGGQERKENSDNSSDNNNKNSTNNHKNSRYHGGGGGSKSSLTESSLKLLSRKLSDISNGVGALLTDCRGSDCDNDSPVHKSPSTPLSPLYKPSSTSHSPLHKPLTPDGYSSVGSGSLHRPSRNTSLKSNSSGRSGILSDSALYTVSERAHTSSLTAPKSSPVQYLGHTTDTDSICGRRQSLEFSEISSLADGESMCGASESARHQGRKLRGSTECGDCGVSCGALHCKPSPGGVPVVPIKSKCCSVV